MKPNIPIPLPSTAYVTMYPETADDGAYIELSAGCVEYLRNFKAEYLALRWRPVDQIPGTDNFKAFALQCDRPQAGQHWPGCLSRIEFAPDDQSAIWRHEPYLRSKQIWPRKPTIFHVTQPPELDGILVPVELSTYDRAQARQVNRIKTPEHKRLNSPQAGDVYLPRHSSTRRRHVTEVLRPDPPTKPTIANTHVRYISSLTAANVHEGTLLSFRQWIGKTDAELLENLL